jgi:hypothetical protein
MCALEGLAERSGLATRVREKSIVCTIDKCEQRVRADCGGTARVVNGDPRSTTRDGFDVQMEP